MNRENSQNGEQIFKGIWRRNFADAAAKLAPTLDSHHMTRYSPMPKTIIAKPSIVEPNDPFRWLIVDDTYPHQMAERLHLLLVQADYLIDRLDNPGIPAAEIELRDAVVDYLLQNYPAYFKKEQDLILSPLAGLAIDVGPNGADPLAAIALLATEDLEIMLPTGQPSDGEMYTFQSGTLLFPNEWSLRSHFNPASFPDLDAAALEDQRRKSLFSARLGKTPVEIHRPAVKEYDRMAKGVESFLRTLQPDSFPWRRNWAPRIGTTLCDHADRRAPELPLEKTNDNWQTHGIIRSEHETFRKLPSTGAIVFGIKTFVWKLSDIAQQPAVLQALIIANDNLSPDMQSYRAKDLPSFRLWLDTLRPR